jgi:porin
MRLADSVFLGPTFLHLSFARNFFITPDVQLLIDPALNTEKDTLWVFGLRARLAF